MKSIANKRFVKLGLVLCLLLASAVLGACGSSVPGTGTFIVIPEESSAATRGTETGTKETAGHSRTETTASPETTAAEPVSPTAPVNANRMSVQQRTASSGPGAATGKYSYLVRQDQTVYYTAPGNKLCSRSVDGTHVSVVIDDLSSRFPNLREIQVVGDWIYLFCRQDDHDYSLSRVRLDGSGGELLADNILLFSGYLGVSKTFNTFIVKDDAVYYTVYDKKQLSASQYEDCCHVCRLDLLTGVEEHIYTFEDMNDLRILAYTEKQALLQGNDEMLMMDLNDLDVRTAPGPINKQGTWDDAAQSWMPGPDGSFWLYLWARGELIRFRKETGCSRELYMEWSNQGYGSGAEFIFLDSETFIMSCQEKIWYVDHAEKTLIVPDEGAKLSYLGDGYIYYSYGFTMFDHHNGSNYCRIRLDGSGWETLDW